MPIKLRDLAASIPRSQLIGDGDRLIAGVTHDSRSVRPDDVFACIKGFQFDGHTFALDAVNKGAAALLVQRELSVSIPQIVVPDTRDAMGIAAAHLFQHPSNELHVVGVTGTNGKTTTSYFIRDALTGDGEICGLIGTIQQWTGVEARPSSRTTPESNEIQRLLREMADLRARACVMEVSSHGLALQRTSGTTFNIAVLTNISRDHFDFHGNYEAYINAKLKLFESLSDDRPGQGVAIINGDQRDARRFIKAATSGIKPASVLTYGTEIKNDVVAEKIKVIGRAVSYLARTPKGNVQIRLRLPGRFNVYNSLAALAVAVTLDVDIDKVASRLEKTVVPGRFEPISTERDIAVFVDYAHTPDSVQNALQTARQLTESKVIVVIGAGGDRDVGKRPIMGRIAAENADIVFFTSDNPRSEDPRLICDAMAAGVKQAKGDRGDVSIVIDREEAIKAAIGIATEGDVVVIAGKGHETYQEIEGKLHFFDDREVARTALKEGGA